MGRFKEGQWGATWIRWLNELDDALTAGLGTVQGYIAQVQSLFAQTDAAREQAVAAAQQAQQIALGVASGLPTVRPSLMADWVNGQVLDPRFLFSRIGPATYVDQLGWRRTAASGVAVFEFSGPGRGQGVRVEPPGANLVSYSEQFDNAVWGKTNAAVNANSAVAPDGALTADQLIESSAVAEHGLTAQNVMFTAGQRYAFSIYARAAGRRYVRLLLAGASFGTDRIVFFDLVAGVATLQGANADVGFGISAPDAAGFRRIWIASTATVSASATACQIRMSENPGGSVTYAGDGQSSIYVWGAQSEVGFAPTSYIPTAASAVSRSGDVMGLSVEETSRALNPRAFTVVLEFTLISLPAVGSAGVIFSYRDALATSRIYAQVVATGITLTIRSPSESPAPVTVVAGVPVLGQRYRLAVTLDNALRASLNGVDVGVGSLGNSPSYLWDRFDIGNQAGAYQACAHFASPRFYAAPVSDAERRTLSSVE